MPASDFPYQLGGSLPSDSLSYIVRQADETLFQALMEGTYCYVLNARQMGKSSLRVRTVDRLLDNGIGCVEVELLGIGSQQITAPQWYGGIIQILIASLGLPVNRRQWLQSHDDLSPVQRLGTFLDQVVLPNLRQPLVLFFDEIDSVLGLNFPTEEFFGLIRSWYEKRATHTLYRQLTVVMLGVATPSDLIADLHATPFNIGRAISLQGFTLAEAQPLITGLTPVFNDPQVGLAAILNWTGGQPFLTQKLCRLVQQYGPALEGTPQQVVKGVVSTHILTHWEAQDEPEHLRTIRNRLLLNGDQPQALLGLYRQILTHGSIAINNSQEQIELRFSGLVIQRQGTLQVFNQIYSSVFDHDWINKQIQTLTPDQPVLRAPPLWQVPLVSMATTGLLMAIQLLGGFQPLELSLFDRLMGWRPPEPADNRFLIVTVSESDIQYQDQQGYERSGITLADQAILQVLNKVSPHQPRVIGVDFYHEEPYSPALANALNALNAGYIGVCEMGRTVETQTPISIAAPPDLEPQQVGFSDFAIDPDYGIRRQIIGMDDTDACPTQAAFSLRLALRYLAAEGIDLSFTDNQQAQLGSRMLPKLSPTSGGYQLPLGELGGYQLLVNYRQQDPVQISLASLLRGEHDQQLATLVRDRIILIGLTDAKDRHSIPGQHQRLPGIVVHAHMTSQLISAVLDQRPLLWWWPMPLEILWVAAVSITGGLLTRWLRSPIILAVSGGGVIVLTSYGLLLIGGWVPVVPASLAWVIAIGVTTLHPKSLHRSL